MASRTHWISDSFKTALQNPLQQGINPALFEKAFAHVGPVASARLIEENKWPLVARRVAGFLSNLPTTAGNTTRSFDVYGNFLNFLGHFVTASLIDFLEVDGARGYIQKVEQVKQHVLKKVIGSADALKELNFSQTLNTLDIPEGTFGQDIALSGSEAVVEEFAKTFATAFKPQIVTRNETKSGTSLRALSSAETQQKLISLAKQMVIESGLISSFDALKVIDEAGCMILEGKEIYTWVEETLNKTSITADELKGIQDQTIEGLRKAAREIIFGQVLKKLETFVSQNPQFPLQAKEVAAYFIQDFYPRVMGVKTVVDGDPINQARQAICPGIQDIQFPRVTLMGIFLEHISPLSELLSVEDESAQVTFRFHEVSKGIHARNDTLKPTFNLQQNLLKAMDKRGGIDFGSHTDLLKEVRGFGIQIPEGQTKLPFKEFMKIFHEFEDMYDTAFKEDMKEFLTQFEPPKVAVQKTLTDVIGKIQQKTRDASLQVVLDILKIDDSKRQVQAYLSSLTASV